MVDGKNSTAAKALRQRGAFALAHPGWCKCKSSMRDTGRWLLYQFLVQDSPKAGLDLEVVNARETISLAR